MRIIKNLLLGVILMLTLSLAIQAAEVETLAIGSPAPAFKLPAVDGKSYSMDNFQQANVLLIIFTCNHCPTAQAYEGRIEQLVNDYKDRGVAVVAISPNDPLAVRLDELGYTDLSDSFEEMKLRAAHLEYNYPYLYDGETQSVSKAYGPKSTPHTFIFDKERRLRYSGGIDDSEKEDRVKQHFVRDALDALLDGKDVAVKQSKTFGCSIKWSDKRGSVKESFEKWAQEEVKLQPITAQGIKDLLKNPTDKLRVINVWATWCGPCVIEFPELVTMNRMYRGRPFELITINANDVGDQKEVMAFLKKQEASMQNYQYSEDDKIALMDAVDKDSSGALPLTVLVKPGGEIVYRVEDQLDPLVLKREIVKIIGNTY